MATPNYSYEKRQRELAKKRKNEEKRQRKANKDPNDTSPDQASDAETGSNEQPAPPPAE